MSRDCRRKVGGAAYRWLVIVALLSALCRSGHCYLGGDSTTDNSRASQHRHSNRTGGHLASENTSEKRSPQLQQEVATRQYGGRRQQHREDGGVDFLFGAVASRSASPPSSPLLPFTSSKLNGGEPRDKMLKSSKDALIVTKKSYLKKDWCKTEPLIQRVREAGCVTRTIVNRFCYGQCNSFYIPKNAKADLEATAFKSCSFCKPKRFRWITITLRCPGRNPPYKRKRIQRIKKCKCISEILQ